MADDKFSGIVRSGSSHSVSVSERTGNAKTPKNIVRSDAEDTESKKRAFEEKDGAFTEANQVLPAASDQQVDQFAGDGSSDPNIQSLEAGALASNKQKLAVEKASHEKREAVGADQAIKANLQSVDTDNIAANRQNIAQDNIADNLQNVGNDSIAANLQSLALGKAIQDNVQEIPNEGIAKNKQAVATDAIAPNNQNVGQGNIPGNTQDIANGKGAAANVQEIPNERTAANQQAIPKTPSDPNNQKIPAQADDENRQPLSNDASVAKDANTAKLATTGNKQGVDNPVPSLNMQSAPEDGPAGVNRQPTDKEKIERAQVERGSSIPPSGAESQPASSNGMVNKQAANTSAKPTPEQPPLTAQQAAKDKHDKFVETFHGRLAHIKRDVDSLNTKLDTLEKPE